MKPQKILLIQTAFIGDAILATGLLEKLHQYYPHTQLDFVVRKGNEGILKEHPFLTNVWIWDKKSGKYKSMAALIKAIRKEKYDLAINLQRFGSTGVITVLSGAKQTIGFDKNPFSRFFTRRISHQIENGKHEVERNHDLIKDLTDNIPANPKIYPSSSDYTKVQAYQQKPYICIAPSSVWFTKQFPIEKWIDLIKQLPKQLPIYLLGSPADKTLCQEIIEKAHRQEVYNLAGELSLLASAALMQGAVMNYVNDSAPMHLASATNAPTCVVYCSTVPAFGFGPLADVSHIVQLGEPLYCRPCGLHGHKSCPEKHFKCAKNIKTEQLTYVLPK